MKEKILIFILSVGMVFSLGACKKKEAQPPAPQTPGPMMPSQMPPGQVPGQMPPSQMPTGQMPPTQMPAMGQQQAPPGMPMGKM